MASETDSAPHPVYSFADIFDALASSLSFEEVLDRILTVSLRELDADQGSLLLLQGEGNNQLKMLASKGLPEEIARRGYLVRKGSITELVLTEQRPIIVNDVPRTSSPDTPTEVNKPRRDLKSALCAPLLSGGRVLGTMNLNRTHNHEHFVEGDLEACSMLAGQAAMVIDNRSLQDQLRQSERLAAVGQTVAGIGHCVKNILAGVKGGLGITDMGMQAENPELTREGFALLKRNVETLSNVVLDLLDYSKEREPLRDRLLVADLLGRVRDTVLFKAEAMGVEVRVDADAMLEYYADSDQLYRAILNLATNAVEAAGMTTRYGDQGLVVLKAHADVNDSEIIGCAGNSAATFGAITIEVIDNGMGIPEEKREAIWDLFYSTKGSKGTGIGLAAARKVIQEHGGEIALDSSAENGTTFRILLPACDPD